MLSQQPQQALRDSHPPTGSLLSPGALTFCGQSCRDQDHLHNPSVLSSVAEGSLGTGLVTLSLRRGVGGHLAQRTSEGRPLPGPDLGPMTPGQQERASNPQHPSPASPRGRSHCPELIVWGRWVAWAVEGWQRGWGPWA